MDEIVKNIGTIEWWFTIVIMPIITGLIVVLFSKLFSVISNSFKTKSERSINHSQIRIEQQKVKNSYSNQFYKNPYIFGIIAGFISVIFGLFTFHYFNSYSNLEPMGLIGLHWGIIVSISLNIEDIKGKEFKIIIIPLLLGILISFILSNVLLDFYLTSFILCLLISLASTLLFKLSWKTFVYSLIGGFVGLFFGGPLHFVFLIPLLLIVEFVNIIGFEFKPILSDFYQFIYFSIGLGVIASFFLYGEFSYNNKNKAENE